MTSEVVCRAHLGALLALSTLFTGCQDGTSQPSDDPPATVRTSDLSHQVSLDEVTTEIGVEFRHSNGMEGEYWIAEIMGAGVALFDYDMDGDLDLYFRQGGSLDPLAKSVNQPTDRLLRNELIPSGSLSFSDISTAIDIQWYGYGMGVATGDFDNDGDVDLYLTNLGPDVLLKNSGDRFVEVAGPWQNPKSLWTTGAVFFDFDRDGWLDLYVGGYVDFTLENHKKCTGADSRVEYCGPLSYEPLTDALFKNQGDHYVDSSIESGISIVRGSALGIVADDFNRDGWPDVLVANDGMDNRLWINNSHGGFVDEALVRGVAVNAVGQKEGSMGIAIDDPDRDGDLDFLLTHLAEESNTLYRSDGAGLFVDSSSRSRLAAPSRGSNGFGVGWLDVDGDSWLDLVSINGAIKTIPEQRAAGDPLPLRQRPQIFVSIAGGERFLDMSDSAGIFFQTPIVGRAAAFGDLDQDGDLDIVITENNGPARVLLNNSTAKRRWFGLHLLTGDPPRDALGAMVRLELADQTVIVGRCQTDGSYLAASDPRVLLRIPQSADPAVLWVDWPDGTREKLEVPTEGTYHEIRQSRGS